MELQQIRRVTKAVLKMVRELNPDGKVYIMEGSATGPTRDVMEYFHYTSEYMNGVDDFICLEEDCGAWQDFDAPEVIKVDLPDGLLHNHTILIKFSMRQMSLSVFLL